MNPTVLYTHPPDRFHHHQQPISTVWVARDTTVTRAQVDRERSGRYEQKIGPAVADDLICEVDVSVARIDGIGDGRHAENMSLGHGPSASCAKQFVASSSGLVGPYPPTKAPHTIASIGSARRYR
jgi:hypothetical protein